MQPRFPADHHFHRRSAGGRAPSHTRRTASPPRPAADLTALVDSAAAYLARQCLPAFDDTDPRAGS